MLVVDGAVENVLRSVVCFLANGLEIRFREVLGKGRTIHVIFASVVLFLLTDGRRPESRGRPSCVFCSCRLIVFGD